jgi:general secretion pathway protein L
MIQTYKAAFPKDPVVIDPVAQLRQKIAAGQRDSGQLAQDDFLALAAAFGEAWAGAGQGPQSIAGLEYRDRGLSVRLKPGSNVPVDRIKTALGSRNLTITHAGTNVLQIRSAK